MKSHRIDGDSMIIALRSGGEVTFERSIVERIEPDEVPYPEPEVTDVTVRLKADTTYDTPQAAPRQGQSTRPRRRRAWTRSS